MSKRIFCFLFTIVLMSVTLFAAAETYKFRDLYLTVDLGSEYTVITKNNIGNNTDIIRKIGHTENSVLSFMDKNSVVMLALKNGNKCQAQISCTETEFSKKVETLSDLGNKEIAAVGEKLFPKGFTVKTVNNTVFLRSEEKKTVKYIAVEHGKTFGVTLYGFSDTDGDEFLSSLRFSKENSGTGITTYVVVISIIIIALIIISIVAIAFVSNRIYKQIKEKSEDDLAAEEIKIKRRKF